jgi:hypothetical protein
MDNGCSFFMFFVFFVVKSSRRGCVVFGLLPAFAFFLLPSMASADGGAVRLSLTKGNYQITVFTAPTPVRAGPVDISVLIQKADTQEPVSEAEVRIKAMQPHQPEMAISVAATTEAATNKLLRAASFELPEAGWWDVEVSIDGPLGKVQSRFELEAGEPLPRYLAMWPWFAWPVVPILVFGIQQAVHHRGTDRDRRNSSKLHVTRNVSQEIGSLLNPTKWDGERGENNREHQRPESHLDF